MLVALDSSGIRTLASIAHKEIGYSCPICHKDVILKQGPIKIHHYAHYPESDCENAGESYRHIEMKWQVGQLALAAGLSLDYEVVINQNRADVLLNRLWVIEVQDSPLSFTELWQRICNYGLVGYDVSWIFNLSRVLRGESKSASNEEFRIVNEILQYHKLTKRIDALGSGLLYQIFLSDAKERSSSFYDADGDWQEYSYIPKTIKKVSIKTIESIFELYRFPSVRRVF